MDIRERFVLEFGKDIAKFTDDELVLLNSVWKEHIKEMTNLIDNEMKDRKIKQ